MLSPANCVPFLGLGLLVEGVGWAGVRPLPVLMPYGFRPVLGLGIGVRQLRHGGSGWCQKASQTPLEFYDSGRAEPLDLLGDIAL